MTDEKRPAREELPRLKALHLPRADWRDILKETAPVPDDLEMQHDLALMDDYFRAFVKPILKEPTGHDSEWILGGPLCVCCGAALTGFFGTFTWGIAHGEGHCSHCGYPGRAKHYKVGPIVQFDSVLQYHPDDLEVKGGA